MLPNYSEEYRILLKLASGTLLEFKGTAEAIVTETKLMDREKEVREMNEELEKLGIADTTAHESEEGITISMENIQFEPDSARLMPTEKEKITRIAALLERYPDKELLISGHTALAGTPGARQKLSEERAEAVAQFLVEMGVRSEYNVYTRGFGAERPVAPNTTEANRARNRRVEITILEK
jgi:outer membrane protein OmpA-like peptidoglycan-associated protein